MSHQEPDEEEEVSNADDGEGYDAGDDQPDAIESPPDTPPAPLGE